MRWTYKVKALPRCRAGVERKTEIGLLFGGSRSEPVTAIRLHDLAGRRAPLRPFRVLCRAVRDLSGASALLKAVDIA